MTDHAESGTNRGALKRFRRLVGLLWVVLIALAIDAFLWPYLPKPIVRLDSEAQAQPRDISQRGELTDAETHTIELFDRASPAAAFISTRAQRVNPWTLDVTEVPRGNGSGVVWDKQGHVLTNFHVIQKASAAEVVLANQNRYDAKLVGVSPDHDLAVLKIDAPAEQLTPLPLGQSDNLQVGQTVYAIGNPFGLDQSLTKGIISALNRQIKSVSGRPIDDVIQTDAAINPGNSGGPLLDSAGRLIGINTAIYSPTGTSAGIGFAVPVSTINRVVPQLINTGRYTRPSLGIRINDRVSRLVSERLGVQGVLVLDVEPGSPAQQADLKPTRITRRSITPGDMILAIDGERVRNSDDLFTILDEHRSGEKVQLTLYHNGERRKVKLNLQ